MARASADVLVRYSVRNERAKRLRNTDSAPKWRLFLPSRDRSDGQFKLSIAFVGGLSSAQILELGIKVVRLHGTADTLYGWADFHKTDIPAGLHAVRDDDPYPRHGNILGWRCNDRKRDAQELAEDSRSQPLPEPMKIPGEAD